MTSVVAVAASAALLPMAHATVYRTPGGGAEVATEGEDAEATYLAVSNGGSARNYTSTGAAMSTTGTATGGGVVISGTGCAVNHYAWVALSATGCAEGGALVVASVLGPVYRSTWSNGDPWVGLSGTGCVEDAFVLAVSLASCATGTRAVSVTGDATAHRSWANLGVGSGTAVSGTGNAAGSGPDAIAVSGTGDATATDANGFAVSGTGDANGTTAVSVAKRRVAGGIAFRGQATLPQFPCPYSPLAGTGTCAGSFSGHWTGSVSGVSDGAAFAAAWTTGAVPGAPATVNANFSYWELLCLAGTETLAGSAQGTGAATAGPGQVLGEWLAPGETVPRAVTDVVLNFEFVWARAGAGAVLTLNPTTVSLVVAGLGTRTVITGTQVGAATFVVKSSGSASVPLCGTPLTDVQGEIVGMVPLAS